VFPQTGVTAIPASEAMKSCLPSLHTWMEVCRRVYGDMTHYKKRPMSFRVGSGLIFLASIFQNLYQSFGRGSRRSLILLCTAHELRNSDAAVL
jgi:hypothetical protein